MRGFSVHPIEELQQVEYLIIQHKGTVSSYIDAIQEKCFMFRSNT